MKVDLRLAVAAVVVAAVLGALVSALAFADRDSAPAGLALPSVRPEPVIPDASGDPTSEPSEPVPSEPSEPDDAATPEPSRGDEEDGDREPAAAPPLADAAPAGEGELPDAEPVSCPPSTRQVTNAEELGEALEAAGPGDVIELADGTYVGTFVTRASGTPDAPIFLCGGSGAVLDGDGIKGGYVLHLDHATHWRLVGFTVRNGQKGVMADGTVGSVIQGLTVESIGDEAIHLRTNSTDNVVLDNTIRDTGLRRDKFGEGVYIGTAVSNWCRTNGCQPDRSDRNVVKGNDISGTTAEAVDVKEGTTGGVVVDNDFDGSKLAGADSWVDVKGNNWLVEGNRGRSTTLDGFQTHNILDGWGEHNVFRANVAVVDAPGLGFAFRPEADNVATCDNRVEGAGEGFSNVSCS